MPKLVTVQAEGDLIWTLYDGELTPWRVRQDGNMERLANQLREEAIASLPEAKRYG